MKNLKYFIGLIIVIITVIACTPDDGPTTVPIRDRGEVDIEDQQKLQEYLDTHFYNYEEFAANPTGADFEIEFDTIAEANSNKTPLSQQVTESFITREEIVYKIYTLQVRQGGGSQSPTFADSALVSYKGFLLENDLDGDQVAFDSSSSPVWFDLPRVVDGFMEGVSQFNGAASITPQPDGTLLFDNSGIGAVFMPSGVGYFSTTVTGVPAYSPLIFTFQLRASKTTDHDGDGVFSKFEDRNGDRSVRSVGNIDNTDEDLIGRFDYVDPDDDDDGVSTKDENADPNGDGDPSDALDTDGDGVPDYLDADTAIAPTT